MNFFYVYLFLFPTLLFSQDQPNSSINGTFLYSVSVDFAESVGSKTVEHSFLSEASLLVSDRLSTNFGARFWYLSSAEKINTDKRFNRFDISDLSASLSWLAVKEIQILNSKSNVTATIGNTLPIDSYSRYEGYVSIPFADVSLSSTYNNLSLVNKVNSQYLINRFSFSTGTGLPNPTFSLSYIVSASYRPTPPLELQLSFGVKRTLYTDSFWDYSYKTSVTLSYRSKRWTPYIQYINGGFSDKGDLSIWFINRYQRVVSGGISYAF